MLSLHTGLRLAATLSITLALTTHAQAVSLGLTDGFDAGLADWVNGAGQIAHLTDGGPNGAGDGYMQITTNGGQNVGSRLVAQNLGSWTGDFITAGITHVSVDVYNPNAGDLHLRLAFKTGFSFEVTHAIVVAANSGWQTLTFDISQANMAHDDNYAAVMSNVAEFRIIHSYDVADPNHPLPFSADTVLDSQGETIPATVGFDNIVAVPEPASLALLALGGLAMIRRKIRD